MIAAPPKETELYQKIKEKEKNAVERFMSSTSFHGVIQAYHHQHILEKSSWALCLSVCIVGFVTHMYLIIERFVGLPTTIDIISSMNYDQFPEITICPMKFISAAKLDKNQLLHQSNFSDQPIYEILYDTIKSSSPLESSEISYINNLRNNTEQQFIVTHTSFGQLIKMRNNMKFWKHYYQLKGEDLEKADIIAKYWDDAEISLYRFEKYMNVRLSRHSYEMIFFCEYNNKPCSWTDFTERDHPLYKRCFIFNYPKSTPNEMPEHLILGLFVDDDFHRRTEDIGNLIKFNGGRITINEPGVFPGTEKSFEQFPSGFQSFYKLKQIGNKKVNKKRAPCVVDKMKKYTIQNDYELDGTTDVTYEYVHNTIICRYYYQQLECAKRCHCLNPIIPVFADVWKIHDHKLNFCNEMTPIPSIGTVIDQMTCLSTIEYDKEFNNKVIAMCYGLCDQVQYSIYSYSMPWFNKTMVKEMDFINEKFSMHYNSIVNNPKIKEIDSVNVARKCVAKSMNSFNIASDCFSLLFIQFESPRKEIIREYEAYLLGNLFSDFGGILGLWIGVSLITIIEVIDISLSLCRHETVLAASFVKRFLTKKIQNRQTPKTEESIKGIENESYEK